MDAAFIAAVGAVALVLVPIETLARSAGAAGRFASTHSMSRPPIFPSFRHGRRNNAAVFWPAADGAYYEPSNGEPAVDISPLLINDVRYTYDVPWDWVHRYPPAVLPSVRPYVSSCSTENVTVTGRDGGEKTINVMRCY
jgi:hypothetical protein